MKEQELIEEQRRKLLEEEKYRLEIEAEERDRLRRAEEHRDIQRKVARERIDQLKRTTLGDRALSQYTEEVSAQFVQQIIIKAVWFKQILMFHVFIIHFLQFC